MKLTGLVDYPFIARNAPVKLGDVTIGRVTNVELAEHGMVEVEVELAPVQVPIPNDEDPRGYSLASRPWVAEQ